MDHKYLAALRPKTDPLTFCRPASDFGRGLLDGPDAHVGCGHVVRLVYMAPKSLTGRRPRPRSACCPICGREYVFAFWKLNSDRDYTPTTEEEADVRALFADLKRMAQGKDPSYDLPLEDRVRIHCLRARLNGGTCDCKGSDA